MKFIVFEGIDGSGLSTQSHLLKEYLLGTKAGVLLTKEPTDGMIGMLIKNTLRKRINFDDTTLTLLFAADRTDHLANINFDAYDYVLSDRYYISNFAYQSQTIDLNFLIEINRYARKPDRVIFLDVKPETCIERITHNRDHIELYENIEQLKLVKENYLKILEHLKTKFDLDVVFVDGNRSIEEVRKDIIDALTDANILEISD
ncbi:MAG: dTMP kinase [Candidatus Altiarchaeum hamiconexum]|uniref:Probable thymidylate kinase n=1 Tax=Candidatus Altarchaeum hamiconexum TaxID=1803513 RepID=A0A8J7YUS6_9ARCH|nr:dTMP kinase [Candidatus Altarchaeum hamiconexum]OIQ04954.1 MAG: dTMP kinase [Candidatus Altarchaeum sp. CG2_30_32_3053]PIN66926.1 MAG: dTMP kinase [Candidatus Altarchaeum sp. CG12_big_fil_rev_8_21_14_0_65_33_22]PIV28259.1 MAG: dTMP kinase [Candidatus Altarchaeum sp. CG03_land_8_20_14_0_80_32_618]PIX49460.1 MAG: dTMP kinase [Candidatus Altarchaeum sp. CG_4_8_14_3_um_filter_33_2054]PIZ32408.1 MAG: dTMP kinase [Candidatus Altarchaeum sp. CG_4_10_14_0_8_um_filter_32_851]PJC15730.1 MAG: dTMP ki